MLVWSDWGLEGSPPPVRWDEGKAASRLHNAGGFAVFARVVHFDVDQRRKSAELSTVRSFERACVGANLTRSELASLFAVLLMAGHQWLTITLLSPGQFLTCLSRR
jgi:hypothetical protein